MRTDVPTIAHVVDRATAHCDPDGADPFVTDFLVRFEDDDRPASAVEDLPGLFSEVLAELDPLGDSPAALMSSVAAGWLATNRRYEDDRERVLRESARAAFNGQPPELVEAWLADQGVMV